MTRWRWSFYIGEAWDERCLGEGEMVSPLRCVDLACIPDLKTQPAHSVGFRMVRGVR